jgi:hypothetical protein
LPLLFLAGAVLLLFSADPVLGLVQAGKQQQPKIQYQFSDTMRFGLVAIGEQGQQTRLTYDPRGLTNPTVIRIDDRDYVFGRQGTGNFVTRQAALGKGPDGKPRQGLKSVWAIGKVLVTQTVEIVRSQTGELDACLIRYHVENKDAKPHKVGIRCLLDTLVGDSDSHPFNVPGQKELITSTADFKPAKEVPEVVQAVQRKDIKNPGVVAEFSLKVGGKLEAPDRFAITTLPKEEKEAFAWDVPVVPMAGDAAVVLWWDVRELNAKQSREVGFAFGLGVVVLDK